MVFERRNWHVAGVYLQIEFMMEILLSLSGIALIYVVVLLMLIKWNNERTK